MATTTPNYGWAVPTSSDLVKNGATDIETLGDSVDASLWNSGFGQAGKNKIINGDFGIWQRGTTFSNPTAGTYTADRFVNSSDGTGATRTISRQTFTPGTAPVAGYEGSYFLRNDVSVSPTGATASNILHRIEDVRTFAGQTITVSFWGKAATAATYQCVALTQNFGSGGSTSVATDPGVNISVTTSWQRFTQTITVPSIAGKTIGTNSYLQIIIRCPLNSVFTFDIWGVQAEYGSKATPFQTASGGSPQAELAMCQRYYQRYPATSSLYTIFGNTGIGNSLTTVLFNWLLPVSMRIAPSTLDYSNLAVTDTQVNTAVSALNFDTNLSASSVTLSATTTGVIYRPYYLRANNSASAYVGFSAEI